NQKYGFHKFIFALNQTGMPNALPTDAVNYALSRTQKEAVVELPYDPELARLLNAGEPVILERNTSPYFSGVSKVLDVLPRFSQNGSGRGNGAGPATRVNTGLPRPG